MLRRITSFLKGLLKKSDAQGGHNCTTVEDEVGYDYFGKRLTTLGYYCRYEGGICFTDMVSYNPNTRSLFLMEEDTGEGLNCPSGYALSFNSETRSLNYMYYSATLCSAPAITIEEVINVVSQVAHSIVPKTWGDFMEEWI